jgi:hypothetical protein
MATYLQNVTDYVPQLQPFQPDLNFYGNVMQTKQTQYDTNWKALNKMYGQYYNAELTRDKNIAKKDNYLKQIEFNLQRVSQLDLSLEQNVDQATQIFKPFYEDKGLMKDMAYTKNNASQKSYGESLKNAYDQKERDQYWPEGILELDFKRQEFKEASDEEAMSMESTQYTPNVDVFAKAEEIAKSSGLSITSTSFGEGGKFIIKTKNGEQLIEPLQKLFEARLGSNSGIQNVYKTKAYVDRKTFAQSNAAQFNGDKNVAEMKYLEDSYNVLKNESVKRYQNLKLQSISYDNKIKNIEEQIKTKTASPEAMIFLSQYKMNKEINDAVLARAEAEQKELSTNQAGTQTSTGFVNPYGDLKSLRFKVDNGMASMLMRKELDEAAQSYAYRNAEQDIDANPFAVLDQKHAYSMQEIAARNASSERIAMLKIRADEEKLKNEHRLKQGTHEIDEETGKIIPVEAYNSVVRKIITTGTSTDKINAKETSNILNNLYVKDIASPFLTSSLKLIEKLIEDKSMTKKEASAILGYSKNPNITLEGFNQKLEKHGATWLRKEVGHKDLSSIEKKLNTWIQQNGEQSGLSSQEYQTYQSNALVFQDYTNYLKQDVAWRKKTSNQVIQELERRGFKDAEYLYDDKGELRSEQEYYKNLPKEVVFKKPKSKYGRSLIDRLGDMDEPKKKKANYESLVEAAGKVYSSNVIKEQPIPGFGSGKSVQGANEVTVNPKAKMTKTSIYAADLLNTINNIDFSDTEKNRVTYQGIGKNAWNNRTDKSNDAAKTIFEAIRAELNNPKSTMPDFKIAVSPIAMNSINKAAVILTPDAEWLKKFVKDNEGKGTGIITVDQYNSAVQNGLSLITDANNISSSFLYKSAFQTPLAAYVEQNKKYVYTDPANPNYKFTISKSTIGGNDYNIKTEYPLFNPNTGETIIETNYENLMNYGTNIESLRAEQVNGIFEKKMLNKLLNNGGYR